jgi:hypothetical protein
VSAPFRELFVEVPQVLLDILRAAVSQQLPAPAPAPSRPSVTAMFVEAMQLPPVVRALCSHYGFEQLLTERSARDRAIDIVGVRPCRYRDHFVVASITDAALEDARDRHALVANQIDRAARHPCFCVAPPRGRR